MLDKITDFMLSDTEGQIKDKIAVLSGTGEVKEKVNKDEFLSLQAESVTSQANKPLKIIACALRNTGSGFQLIDDTAHDPINTLSVTNDTAGVTLSYDVDTVKVVALVATPDETLAGKGFFIGASVGGADSVISLNKTDDVYGYFTKSGGDVPVFTKLTGSKGISSATWDSVNKKLVIAHDKCYCAQNIDASMRGGTGKKATSVPLVNTYVPGGIESQIEFHTNKVIQGYVYYNGSALVVDPSSSGILSAVWNATTNNIDVTTEECPGWGFNLTPKDTPLKVEIDTMSSTMVGVQFRDISGAIITALSTDMKVVISKIANNTVNVIPDDNEVLLFRRQGGVSLVDPNDVVFTNSNIWVMGLMEV